MRVRGGEKLHVTTQCAVSSCVARRKYASSLDEPHWKKDGFCYLDSTRREDVLEESQHLAEKQNDQHLFWLGQFL